ncbi:MAG TPA: lytic transglycosylase domain-containing protein [Edaphobacter sp.]
MRLRMFFMVFLAPHVCNGQGNRPLAEACVQRYAFHYRVPPELIGALIDVESGWNPLAVSNKGAMGFMQLMPATAVRFGAFNPFNPEQDIAAGTRYVTTLMWEFSGDLRLVAAAYYTGDHWVGKKQLSYSNPDVVAYVRKVRRRYIMRKSAAVAPPKR